MCANILLAAYAGHFPFVNYLRVKAPVNRDRLFQEVLNRTCEMCPKWGRDRFVLIEWTGLWGWIRSVQGPGRKRENILNLVVSNYCSMVQNICTWGGKKRGKKRKNNQQLQVKCLQQRLTIAYNTAWHRHAAATVAVAGCRASRWERLAGSSERLQACREREKKKTYVKTLKPEPVTQN